MDYGRALGRLALDQGVLILVLIKYVIKTRKAGRASEVKAVRASRPRWVYECASSGWRRLERTGQELELPQGNFGKGDARYQAVYGC